jgi:hypothetical protein
VRKTVLVLAVFAVVAACSGNSVSTGETTSAGSTTSSASITSGSTVTSGSATTARKVRIGTVIGTVPNGGKVNNVETNDGDPLAALDVIGTNPDGKVAFSVGNALPSCNLDGDSAVQVQPTGNVVLSVRQGVVTCRTSTTNQKNFVAGQTVVTAVDPVVVIGYDGRQATVRVAQGYVGVRSGGGLRVVGARQQASAGGGGVQVQQWDPSSLAPADNVFVSKEVNTAVSQARVPAYPALSDRSSPVLGRADQRGSFAIDVVGGDDHVIAAATAFLSEFLRHGTSLEVQAETASAAEASAALQKGDIDGVIVANGQGSPLFTIDGATWRVVLPSDQGTLQASLQSFLSAALLARCTGGRTGSAPAPSQSCYETTYRSALQTDQNAFVPLDGLAPYLGLR